ncbi:MAG: hypothetical protein CO125_12800 [Hydrogenophilales bacterium CG_4_9_14_3_um_filter_59_35]|nr:MAG: hypothetical protein CO125_12800 [Hydrogenophilales bacterium CG_4_9_14_3_um_filter_59_35]
MEIQASFRLIPHWTRLFPPNLLRQIYTDKDWAMLQARPCSFEHHPGDEECRASRKTSCSLVVSITLPKE